MHHAEAGAKFVHCVTTDKCDVNTDSTPQTLNSHTTFCDVNRRSALRDAHFSKFVYFLAPRGHKNCTKHGRERNFRHVFRLRRPLKGQSVLSAPPLRIWAIRGVSDAFQNSRGLLAVPLRRGTVPLKILRRAGAAATFPEKARTAQGLQQWLK